MKSGMLELKSVNTVTTLSNNLDIIKEQDLFSKCISKSLINLSVNDIL